MATFTGNDSSNTISGTSSADTIYGRGGNDVLRGNSGDDRIYGESGNDRLYGGYGNDFLYGGIGDDWLKGEWGNDTLFGDSGNDILYGDGGNDRLVGGDGNDQLYGGDGYDRMEGGAGNDTYHSSGLRSGTIAGDELTDTGGIDTLVFYETGVWLPDNIENLTLRTTYFFVDAHGNSLNNTIRNESSADAFIDGGAGNDTLIGGSGFDHFTISSGNDFVDGGGGSNWLYGGSINFLTGTATNGTGTTTFVNIATGQGGSGSDRMVADNAGRHLLGGGGNDVVAGGSGADELYGDGGFDHPDTELGDDRLTGSGGNDFLQGGMGRDTLDGGTGNDRLRGSGDELDGWDRFIFSSVGSANADHILDFQPGIDELAFDNARFSALGTDGEWSSGDGRFHAAAGATAGHDANDRLIYDTNLGNLYYDPDGSGGTAASIVATLDSVPGLTSSDITVI
jgi:Ca2+-binding RTX toxin-like protein